MAAEPLVQLSSPQLGRPAAPAVVAPGARQVDLDWRSVVVMLGAFVVLVTLSGLVGSTRRTLAALAVATLLTLALNPLVGVVRRHVPVGRGAAVAMVVAAATAVVTVLGLMLVPPAIRQARDLGAELPAVVAELGDLLALSGATVHGDVGFVRADR